MCWIQIFTSILQWKTFSKVISFWKDLSFNTLAFLQIAKYKVKCKTSDVMTWLTNNCNTRSYCPIFHEVKAIRPGNEIWSFNRIKNIRSSLTFLIEYKKRNIFSSNIMENVRQGDYFQTSFCFLKFYTR